MNLTENFIFENPALNSTLPQMNTDTSTGIARKTERDRINLRQKEIARAMELYKNNHSSIAHMIKVLLMDNDRVYLLAAIIFFAVGKWI